MGIFRVKCHWMMDADIEIEANSADEAVALVEDNDDYPDGYFVKNSLVIDNVRQMRGRSRSAVIARMS